MPADSVATIYYITNVEENNQINFCTAVWSAHTRWPESGRPPVSGSRSTHL